MIFTIIYNLRRFQACLFSGPGTWNEKLTPEIGTFSSVDLSYSF